jgi:hypothetical protein
MSDEEKLHDFSVEYVTYYDGTGHRLGPSDCTLTTRRLLINDSRGGMHQIALRDISEISTPSRMLDPKMLRIGVPTAAYRVRCVSKEQKRAIEAWLSQAIRSSF